MMCFIAHDTTQTSLPHGLVEFRKGKRGSLDKGVLQLLRKAQRTTISFGLGHHKLKTHCFET